MRLNEFLSICARIVRAWPQVLDSDGNELVWLRPNAFAFVYDEAEMGSENFGKDERYETRDHFFCRRWEDHGFQMDELQKEGPSVFCYERVSDLRDRDSLEMINLEMVIQDDFVRAWANDIPEYKQRSKEEIAQDLRSIRDTFIKALETMVYISGKPGIYDGWYPEPWLRNEGVSTAGGKKLTSLISFGNETSTFPRVTDGGTIETYFRVSLRYRYCPVIDLDSFNFG